MKKIMVVKTCSTENVKGYQDLSLDPQLCKQSFKEKLNMGSDKDADQEGAKEGMAIRKRGQLRCTWTASINIYYSLKYVLNAWGVCIDTIYIDGRKYLHRSDFGFTNSWICAAQVESAVGKPIHKPKIGFSPRVSITEWFQCFGPGGWGLRVHFIN